MEVTQRGDLGRLRHARGLHWHVGGQVEVSLVHNITQDADQTLLVLTIVDVEGCHVVHDDGAPEVLILILGLVSI